MVFSLNDPAIAFRESQRDSGHTTSFKQPVRTFFGQGPRKAISRR
jgi:hypothetical protein